MSLDTTIDDKTISEIKEKIAPRDLHELEIVSTSGEETVFLVSTPSKPEWMKFLSDVNATEDSTRRYMAHENFALAVTQWPSREEAKAFLATNFGSITQITDQLGQLVGSGAQVRAKKL